MNVLVSIVLIVVSVLLLLNVNKLHNLEEENKKLSDEITVLKEKLK